MNKKKDINNLIDNDVLTKNSDSFDQWIESLGDKNIIHKVNTATDMTIKDLTSYGNCIDDNYHKALQQLIYYMMFYNNKSKVLTVPLATGAGKSTAMINTIVSMNIDQEFKPFCGTIILKLLIKDCDETVEAINNKHKELLRQTGGEYALYNYKPIARAYHSQSDVKEKDLKTSKFPILVTTHAMFNSMINNEKIGELLTWNSAEYNSILQQKTYYRRRVIIDEEFKGIKFYNINMETLSIIENASMNLCGEDLFKKFNDEVIFKLKQQFVKSYKMENNNILFTRFNDISISNDIREVFAKSNNHQAKESLKAILNMLEHGAYIHKEDDIQKKSFTTYKFTNLNCDIFNQILLDATADVNSVYKINPNYTTVNMPKVKTYKNTYLHIFDGVTGSRQSMIDNFEDGLLDAIINNIKDNINVDEDILIVVNKIELKEHLKEKFKDYEYEKNINYAHYGAITGLNNWANCKKQFMIGIPLVSQENYCLMYYCNAGENDFNKLNNNMRPIKGAKIFIDDNIESLRKGVIASEIIQALNRCQVRKLINGDTPETHLYMINKDKTIDYMIKTGMPEINLLYDWDISYTSISKNKTIETDLSTEQKLINLMRRIIENTNYRNILINEGKYIEGKGIKKSILRELLEIQSTAFKNAMNKPLAKQFFNDYNINLGTGKSQYILLI